MGHFKDEKEINLKNILYLCLMIAGLGAV